MSGKYFPETDNIKIIVRSDLKKSKVKKFFFEIFNGYKFINSYEPDVYISLQNIATLGVKAKKQIVYLHQPIPFQTQKKFSFFKSSERKLAFYQHVVGRIIKKSISKVQPTTIVQTKWMKNAVCTQTNLDKAKIIVKHPFVNMGEKGEKYINNKTRSFFYPASEYLYKNHILIYDAIRILNKNNINDFKVILTVNGNNELSSNNVEFIGHIERNKVFKMYEDSVLIFPSYIESFGLPLIEAALRADIVLAADTEFARELLSNYDNVYFFPYNNPKALAELMLKVLNGNIISNGIPLQLTDNGELLLTTIEGIINK